MITSIKKLLKRSHLLQSLNDRLKLWKYERRRKPQVAAYLAHAQEPRLHIGCGGNILPGWLNTDQFAPGPDVVHLNATKSFPFGEATFKYVLSEHMIEHISHQDARSMLRECARVMQPGGVIRIGTPDVSRYVEMYQGKGDGVSRKALTYLIDDWIAAGFHCASEYRPERGTYNPLYVLNDVFMNYEHRFIYDYPTLEQMLLQAGFTSCVRCNAGRSSHPALNTVETHVDEVNAYLTLTIEAVR